MGKNIEIDRFASQAAHDLGFLSIEEGDLWGYEIIRGVVCEGDEHQTGLVSMLGSISYQCMECCETETEEEEKRSSQWRWFWSEDFEYFFIVCSPTLSPDRSRGNFWQILPKPPVGKPDTYVHEFATKAVAASKEPPAFHGLS